MCICAEGRMRAVVILAPLACEGLGLMMLVTCSVPVNRG